jgi:hypothetical protein
MRELDKRIQEKEEKMAAISTEDAIRKSSQAACIHV